MNLPLITGIPFLGVLLSIALGPLLIPRLWHRFENPLLFLWGVLSIAALWVYGGGGFATHEVTGTLLQEYTPFMVILFTTFSLNGGIHFSLSFTPTPLNNTLYLAFAGLCSNILGTTGASLLFLRPFLRINRHRRYRVPLVIFFILIVANVGGCLTPLGDPPLFMGYLKGVDFLWSLQNLWKPCFFVMGSLLGLFALVEAVLLKKDPQEWIPFSFGLEGKVNLVLLAVLVAAILGTPHLSEKTFSFLGHPLAVTSLIRDGIFLMLAALSLWITPKAVRHSHAFSWAPLREVGRVFLAIFITLIPVSMMLQAGVKGPFAPLFSSISLDSPKAFYWGSGFFSAFLDNAPTYLVFYTLGGGSAVDFMGVKAPFLMAISLGSVFFGALTYIGNTPNFVIRSIAQQSGVKMPSFLGYMLWALALLGPILGVVSWVLMG